MSSVNQLLNEPHAVDEQFKFDENAHFEINDADLARHVKQALKGEAAIDPEANLWVVIDCEG